MSPTSTPAMPPAPGAALIVTARPAELDSLGALLDSIDPAIGSAWVVLQDVAPSDRDQVATHAHVERVIEAPLIPLSHARNLALHEIFAATNTGWVPTFIGFPDADGRYAPGALSAVAEAVTAGADLVVGRYGPEGGPIDHARFPDEPGDIDWGLARSRATSVTLFVSGEAAIDLGYVMPFLGLGTPLPAGEDVEYALRLLKGGGFGRYVPEAITYHPYGTELDPRRRPIRYLLLAAYPPPLGRSLAHSGRRLFGGHSVPSETSNQPTEAATAPAPSGFGLSGEAKAAIAGFNPRAVRWLRHFAAASRQAQWPIVRAVGMTGELPATKSVGGPGELPSSRT